MKTIFRNMFQNNITNLDQLILNLDKLVLLLFQLFTTNSNTIQKAEILQTSYNGPNQNKIELKKMLQKIP